MNFSVRNITEALKALTRSNVYAPLRSVGHPDRDWQYLLIATSILMLMGLGLTSFTLLRSDVTPNVPGAVRVETLSRDQLRATLEDLRERQSGFEALRRTPPALIDPSR